MISIDIPSLRTVNLEHLVLDFNGTLAADGRLLNGIVPRMAALANQLSLHVITGNTYGNAPDELKDCLAEVVCLPPAGQAAAKRDHVIRLGRERVVAIGNGRNDAAMLELAALGIAVLGPEGLAVEALNAARIVVPNVVDALDLLLLPQRLIATLRG